MDRTRVNSRVVVAIVLRQPLAVVAGFASDPSNAPAWYAKISQVESKTPPPIQVGSQVAFVARFLGRELRYTYEIVEQKPTSLVVRTAQRPNLSPTSSSYERIFPWLIRWFKCGTPVLKQVNGSPCQRLSATWY